MPAIIQVTGELFRTITEALQESEEVLKRADRKLTFGDSSAKKEVAHTRAVLRELRESLLPFLVPDLLELLLNLVRQLAYLRAGILHLYEPMAPEEMSHYVRRLAHDQLDLRGAPGGEGVLPETS